MSVKKKPRTEIIEWTTKGVVSEISFEIDPVSGKIELNQADPKKTKVKKVYEKDSGREKTLSSVHANSKSASFDTHNALIKGFDYIIAIDTNTKEHAGKRLAITTAYYIEGTLVNDESQDIPYKHLCSFLIKDLPQDENPEPIGWYLTLRSRMNPKYFKSKRLGIVVDSELGNHEAYNTRQKAFYGRYLLPQEFSFIYGSSDAGDELPNMMIRMCDKVSNLMFQKILPHLNTALTRNFDEIPESSAKYIELTGR